MRYIRFILIAVACSLWAAASAAHVASPVNPVLAQSGQSFSIGVDLTDATNIRGYGIRISFDPALLSYTSVNRGSLFNGVPVNWWRIFVDEPGLIRVECLIFGEGLYVSGPGRLFTMNFTSLAEGYSGFNFDNVTLYDPEGTPISGSTSQDADIILGSASYARIKCFLQGPYNEGSMRTDITGLLPLSSPYDADPVILDQIPEDAVDWGLIELRSIPTGYTIYSRSVLFCRDGFLRSPKHPYLILWALPPGNYYVVVRHRNHLDLMTSSPVGFVSGGAPSLHDLSQLSNVYGQAGVTDMGGGVYAMASGDADGDEAIYPTDRNLHWRIQAGSSGYKSADFNLDGNVFPNDLNLFWRLNSGLSSRVPVSSGRSEQ